MANEELTKVQTSIGEFKLKKPNAGVRNRCLIMAEEAATEGKLFSMTVFMFEFIPFCIAKRPEVIDQDTPIKQILDSLSQEDYNLIFEEVLKQNDVMSFGNCLTFQKKS